MRPASFTARPTTAFSPTPARERWSAARSLLKAAREHDRAGRIAEAVPAYRAAVTAAEADAELRVLADALRHLSFVQYRRREGSEAKELCHRSHTVAVAIGDAALAAAALNLLRVYDLDAGDLE